MWRALVLRRRGFDALPRPEGSAKKRRAVWFWRPPPRAYEPPSLSLLSSLMCFADWLRLRPQNPRALALASRAGMQQAD